MSSAAPQPQPHAPPRTIRIKRARDEAPVAALVVTEPTAKKIKTETPKEAPSYVFRLSHTFTRFQPTEGVVRKVPALEGVTSTDEEQSKSRKRQSSFDPAAMRAESAEEDVTKRRKIAPVRKYQLSRRARGRHEPYSGAGRHGAVFERVRDEDEMRVVSPAPNLADLVVDADTGVVTKTKRKRPRTHPKEKEMIRSRSKELEDKLTLGYEEDEKLMRDMERMVLEYLNADTNDGIKNLPPREPAANDKIGGGVGGGTWKDDKEKDIDMTDEEDEEGYVYDVYYREEVPTGAEAKPEGESYGIIVFAESDDEAWWYEGADEEDDRSDVYGSDDEDSNAEDYHTNDYPDEPAFPEDEDDEYGIAHEKDEEAEDEYSDSEPELGMGRWRPWRPRTVPGDEEYDLDDSDEDDEPSLRRMVRGTWSLD